MKKETDIILYPAGAYGNFIHWCYSYFAGYIKDIEIPFTKVGSVHSRFENDFRIVISNQELLEYLESDITYPVAQMHDSLITKDSEENLIQESWFEYFISELDYLSDQVNKILYIYPSAESSSWFINNVYSKINLLADSERMGIHDIKSKLKMYGLSEDKITELSLTGLEKLQYLMNNEINKKNLEAWGHTSIDEFQRWEFRELCSYYYYDRCHARILSSEQINILKNTFKDIKFVSLDELRDDFVSTLESILLYFNLLPQRNKIKDIQTQWLATQKHIFKDQIIDNIVLASINKTEYYYNMQDLTFIDEIFIQRQLKDLGYEISCYGLNTFPSNTIDLHKLLIKQ